VTPPRPRPDPDTAPFWAATLAGRLDLQRCASCGLVVFYPRARCPRCHGDALVWATMSGRGAVYASTVVHRPADESFAAEVPYVVALVDLDEGARLMARIVGCPPEEVRTGMPVTVRFRQVSDEAALPVFVPAETSGTGTRPVSR
jgi:uncharacterized OB-fold protein